MNPRYIETFSRHRALLCTPIVLAVIISAWFVLGAPKSYQSTASLWLDNPPPAQTSVADTNPAILPPANQEQNVLTELLATREFRLAVGHRGPLAQYLATHGVEGWGPSALLARLKGTASVDDRIFSALGHGVTTSVAGPQVLQVSLQGPTPAVAAGTLSALLAEFGQARSSTRRTRAQATTAYYQGQVDAAQKAFDGAQQALISYRGAHPGATGSQDPSLRALVAAEKAAAQHLTAARNGFDQASIDAASPLSSAAAFRVIDAPREPSAPTGGKKKALMALVAGLFVGAIVSLLGTIGLTSLEGRDGGSPEPRKGRVKRAHGDRRRPRFAFAGSTLAAVTRTGRAAEASGVAEGDAASEAEDADDGEVRGTIVAVRDDGQGRRTRPVWTVRRLFGGARVGPGNRVAILGTPGRTGLIRDSRDAGDDHLFEVEITNRKLGVRGESGQLSIRPADRKWVGLEVAFTPIANGGHPDPILEAVHENGHGPQGNGTNGAAGTNGAHGTNGANGLAPGHESDAG
jgi:uncharacterized protein involved in exopolysaccharide biosynthesis